MNARDFLQYSKRCPALVLTFVGPYVCTSSMARHTRSLRYDEENQAALEITTAVRQTATAPFHANRRSANTKRSTAVKTRVVRAVSMKRRFATNTAASMVSATANFGRVCQMPATYPKRPK